MNTQDQRGEIDVLLIPLILVVFLFFGAIGFGYWAFMGRQDYKNNTDQKISVAVSGAKKITQAQDQAIYLEAAKLPLKTYVGPETYGAVNVSYPKSWSGYVDTSSSSTPLNAYFHPDVVPAAGNSRSVAYALRVQVLQQTYSDAVRQYQSQVQNGSVTVKPFKLVKVQSVVGVRVDGQITTDKNGTVILLPLRDKTLVVSTESKDFMADFNNKILPAVTFSP
jgi:hypothetical protein